MTDLASQVALVTGSSRGLGATIAKRLAEDGATIAVNYRTSKAKADQVVADIVAAGGKAEAFQGDTTDPESVATMIDAITKQLGPIRILVNNSGIMSDSPIKDMEIEAWDEMMASHLRSHFLVVRECLRAGMGELDLLPGRRVRAKIVNMSSGVVPAGGRAAINKVHYVTAKAGVEGFTRAIAGELAERKITVNMVQPGIHFTGMGGNPTDETKKALSNIFLLGLPDDRDVADSVAFFATAPSDHITAESLMPNGGSA